MRLKYTAVALSLAEALSAASNDPFMRVLSTFVV
jgi:hypothetical protein